MTDITKDHFSKNGSKTDTFNFQTNLTEFRELAFDHMSVGQMKVCYSNSEYRSHKTGLVEADFKTLAQKTDVMVTWYFLMIVRYVSYTANAVWKDVVGENLNFKLSIAHWKDMTAAQKKVFKAMEESILNTVGPSFKVIENNLKDNKDKKLFVQYYRRILDT